MQFYSIEEKGMKKCPAKGGTPSGPGFCECINPDYIDLVKSNSLKMKRNREKWLKRQKNVGSADAPPTPTSTGESSQGSSSSSNSDNQPSTSKPEREGAPAGHSSVSSFLPGKVRKENGNTSPKPFSAAYEDYPTISHAPKTEKPPDDDDKWETEDDKLVAETAECCKYRSECIASLTKYILNEIKLRCIHLKDLRLEYCNLDCNPVC